MGPRACLVPIPRAAPSRLQARQPPEKIEDLVEFFLDTEAPEMEFEVARCRPQLTPEFFAYLDRRIGARDPVAACLARVLHTAAAGCHLYWCFC